MDAQDRLSAEDRTRMAALLTDVIDAMRQSGRDPQEHQFALGSAFAEHLRAMAAQGVPWAARVWFLHADRVDLGLEALLRQHGIEPEL